MTESIWLWVSFNVFVLAMLALDPCVFHYLKLGVGAVLTFVGVNVVLAPTAWKIDTLVSLGVIVLILATSVVMSLLRPKQAVRPSRGHALVLAPAGVTDAPRDAARTAQRAVPTKS